MQGSCKADKGISKLTLLIKSRDFTLEFRSLNNEVLMIGVRFVLVAVSLSKLWTITPPSVQITHLLTDELV